MDTKYTNHRSIDQSHQNHAISMEAAFLSFPWWYFKLSYFLFFIIEDQNTFSDIPKMAKLFFSHMLLKAHSCIIWFRRLLRLSTLRQKVIPFTVLLCLIFSLTKTCIFYRVKWGIITCSQKELCLKYKECKITFWG